MDVRRCTKGKKGRGAKLKKGCVRVFVEGWVTPSLNVSGLKG